MSDLAKFAKADFALNTRLKDGSTVRENLLSAFEQTGELPEQLKDAPALPEHAVSIWDYFKRLHRRRSYGVEGPEPISPERIAAWASLLHVRLDPWEVEAILAIDDEFLEASAKKP